MDGLGRVLQQIEQHLLQLVADAGHPIHARVEVTDDIDGLEVEAFHQGKVVSGDLQCLVDQHRQMTVGQLAVAHATETEHVADDLRGPRAGLLDTIEQLRHLAALQVLVDCLQAHPGFLGRFAIALELGGEPATYVLGVVQDGAEGVVDLVSHAGRQAAHRKHLLRLHHHFFHVDALGDVVDADHHATTAAAGQWIAGERVVVWLVVAQPGHFLDLFHHMLLGAAADLREEGLERLEGDEYRLIQRIVQRRAGKGAGFLIPLGDVELLVEGDQRRGHRVDDAIEVFLEAGELLFDLAAHLHFQLQFTVGVARFLGQTLGMVEGFLGVVTGALELLLTGFHARQHGVEGIGEATDLVLVAGLGAQGIVLLAGDLARQRLQIANRPGNELTDLTRHQNPEQQTGYQDGQARRQRAGVERAWQFAAGHHQQMPGAAVRLR